jgi:hypothetical protein
VAVSGRRLTAWFGLLLAIAWSALAGASGLISMEGRVSGSVIDSLSARPIRYALVTVVGSRANALTDSLGRYLIERCPTGPQTIRATAMGYDPAVRPLTIRGAVTDTLRIRLRRHVGSIVRFDTLSAPGARR